MNKLSKMQQERIAIVAVCAPLLMAALWFLGVKKQQEKLQQIAKDTTTMNAKLDKAETAMEHSQQIASDLDAHRQLLQKREATMSPDRDAYAWIIETINPFIQPRKGVNIYSYSQADFSDTGIIPDFPYRWATFHLKGSGYYYEFGRFFADLENTFPYFRVQGLQIGANTGPAGEPEKLGYTFDIVTPVTTNSP